MLSTHTHAHAHCVAERTYVRSGVTSSRIFGCLSVSLSAAWILEVVGTGFRILEVRRGDWNRILEGTSLNFSDPCKNRYRKYIILKLI